MCLLSLANSSIIVMVKVFTFTRGAARENQCKERATTMKHLEVNNDGDVIRAIRKAFNAGFDQALTDDPFSPEGDKEWQKYETELESLIFQVERYLRTR